MSPRFFFPLLWCLFPFTMILVAFPVSFLPKPVVPVRQIVEIIPTPLPLPTPQPITSTIEIPILMYHYIEHVQDKRDVLRERLNVQPEIFAYQIETMQNAGYTFLTMAEVDQIMNGILPMPNKPVVLTFDDGYADFYTDAFPVLQKYQVKATQYVISGVLGKKNYMTVEQVQELPRSGLVEIGAHTVNHVSLGQNIWPTVQLEVSESKRQLESMIGAPVVSFAYPNGSYDEQAKKAVAQAGYKTAVVTKMGVDVDQERRFELRRLRPGNRTTQALLLFLDSSIASKL